MDILLLQDGVHCAASGLLQCFFVGIFDMVFAVLGFNQHHVWISTVQFAADIDPCTMDTSRERSFGNRFFGVPLNIVLKFRGQFRSFVGEFTKEFGDRWVVDFLGGLKQSVVCINVYSNEIL